MVSAICLNLSIYVGISIPYRISMQSVTSKVGGYILLNQRRSRGFSLLFVFELQEGFVSFGLAVTSVLIVGFRKGDCTSSLYLILIFDVWIKLVNLSRLSACE